MARGDAQRAPSGEQQVAIPEAVGVEAPSGAVRRAAVKLDDELVLRPDAVALVAEHVEVAPWPWQAMGVEELHEGQLEIGPGAAGEWSGEEISQDGSSRSSRVALDQVGERDAVGQPQVLGFVHRALDGVRWENGRKVQKRARDRRARDAVADGDLVGLEPSPVHADPGSPSPAGDRDLDGIRAADAVQRGRRTMAQDRTRATGQDGGHPSAPLRKAAVPDRVDPAVDLVQPPRRQRVFDRSGAQRQLPSCDHAVLALRELVRGRLGRYSGPR